ncbi:hypothetical protein [Sulfobacillus harzensis]|uniref:Uncharacterized protein n=1 Tax=Sulfobacillus harzensis TaxID=2729629 RepID=A0A7Y0Q4A1_9FIRM|nr:hypothetical protein [Sulfobacillus harzensis]NMP23029.1 hypothetical protein [Sulfobacillus harzensis]
MPKMQKNSTPRTRLADRLFREMGKKGAYDSERMAAFGAWLQNYRESANWTQARLGYELTVSDQSVRKAEQGALRWRRERYAKLFEMWDVVDYTWTDQPDGSMIFVPRYDSPEPAEQLAAGEAMTPDEQLMLSLYRSLAERDQGVLRAMAGVLAAAR